MPQPKHSNVYRLRPVSSNVNDWDVITILSQGLPERKVTRLNGDVEHIKYSRDYFKVETGASSPEDLYRLSKLGLYYETWKGMEALQANIPSRGQPVGFDIIASCLLEDGSSQVTGHEEINKLADLRMEFLANQRYIDSHDLRTIDRFFTVPPQRERNDEAKPGYLRIPSKVWDDTNLKPLSMRLGWPVYWLGAVSIMVSLVKQSMVNAVHTSKMKDIVREHFETVESRYRMCKGCMENARYLDWGPEGLKD